MVVPHQLLLVLLSSVGVLGPLSGLSAQALVVAPPHNPALANNSTPLGKLWDELLQAQVANALMPRHTPRDAALMKLALRHAENAYRAGEVPVGAVIVSGDGEVIGASGNAVEATKDASAHAEILAMRLAAEHRGDWRLFDCTLLRRLVYGAMSDDRPGVKAQTSLNVLMTGGLLPEESSALLKAFFRSRRLVKHRHPLCSGQGQ